MKNKIDQLKKNIENKLIKIKKISLANKNNEEEVQLQKNRFLIEKN